MSEPVGPALSGAVPSQGEEEALAALRSRIDGVDRELLALLNRRAALAIEVGEVKKREGSPTFRPEREAQVIAGLRAANPGPLGNDGIGPIWREIMSACRALETPTRVAFLGPAGTFSQSAAIAYFGSSMQQLSCSSIDEVFRAATAGAADFGVVPVENSTEGAVARSLDLFLATPLTIVGELSLAIRHNLLRRIDSLDGVVAVCAHPQALAQCHRWLGAHLPQAERRPMASNAQGAQFASRDDSLAALASDHAASEYGLHIVANAVQDDPNNRTRFAVVAHPDRHPPSRPTGRDCTSLVVAVDNRPGALHDLLVPLKEHGVSMTRFESRPFRSGQWEYYFYIDIDGHREQSQIAAALDELRSASAFFKLLGSYPVEVQ